jgi:cytochrome c5
MRPGQNSAIAAIAALVLGLLGVALGQQTGTPAKAGKGSKNPVQEISLPNVPIDMPPGPNLAVYQQKCQLCHTSRYVTMQPRFSRTVWEKEVKKMVDVYGAPIAPEEQQEIVEYLVAIRGPAETK